MKKTENNCDCPVAYTLGIIGGKWKPLILYLISKGENRFGILLKEIAGVSKHMLTKQLRELESDGLITRCIYPEVPPRVEYSVTEKGNSLFPIIYSMHEWGKQNQTV